MYPTLADQDEEQNVVGDQSHWRKYLDSEEINGSKAMLMLLDEITNKQFLVNIPADLSEHFDCFRLYASSVYPL